MQLTMKQAVFSLKERFLIYDETGQTQYEVSGQFFSLGHKLTILDRAGRPVGQIRQKLLSFTAKYFLDMEGQPEAELSGHVTLFQNRYTLSLPEGDWDICGDFLHHEYEMTQNGRLVASVTRKLFSWGDTYLLEIPNPKHTLLALGVMLAIDCVMADANTAATTTTWS